LEFDVPKTNRRAKMLGAHVTWDSEFDVTYVEAETHQRSALGRTQGAAFLMVDYILMLDNLGIAITPELHDRMIAATEQRARSEAIEAGKVPEEPIPIYTSPDRHEPVVYYMRLGDLVKIGWSTNINWRARSLTVQGIMAIEPGGRELEQRRHNQFAAFHHHGEWFRLEPELGEWIIDRREAFEAFSGLTVERWLANPPRAT
jgi:hypothetical protein